MGNGVIGPVVMMGHELITPQLIESIDRVTNRQYQMNTKTARKSQSAIGAFHIRNSAIRILSIPHFRIPHSEFQTFRIPHLRGGDHEQKSRSKNSG